MGGLLNGGYFARRVRGAPRVVVRTGDYLPPVNATGSTTAAPSAAAVIFAIPFWHDQAVSWDRVSMWLTTAQAGAACRIGAYDWNNGAPNGSALLSDFGELDMSTGTGTEKALTINWTNPLADWWMVVHCKNVATQFTCRAFSGCIMRGTSMLSSSLDGNAGCPGWRGTETYAALPETLYSSFAPFAGTTPLVFLRRA